MKWTFFWKQDTNTGVNMAINKTRGIKKIVWCRVYQTYQKCFHIIHTYTTVLFPSCIVITSLIFRLVKWCILKHYSNVSFHLLHDIYSFLAVLLTHSLSHSDIFAENILAVSVVTTWRMWRGKEERGGLRRYWIGISCEAAITISSQKHCGDTAFGKTIANL